eukprot:TRINITY_DN25588_c1_g1_i1.p1 TRINITY_DN25588_c1_g1~~TRINITY_DN25588_c1_g1_i1.p1  ORF type:complete len:135 (-),score=38.03 TRINITY_DN25588_c1_g1_i1:99-503(-)
MSRGSSSNMSGSNMVPLGSSGRVGGGSSSSSSSSSGSSLLKPSYLSQPPPSSMPSMPPRNYDMPNMPNRDFPNMPNMQTAMVSFGQVDRAERKEQLIKGRVGRKLRSPEKIERRRGNLAGLMKLVKPSFLDFQP